MEKIEITNCKKCDIQPRVVNIDGCWYTYCPKCKHHGVYNCCSRSREGSIEQWNINNRAITEYVRPPRKVIPQETKAADKTIPHIIIPKY